ncbi:cation diffusion facilitator family transporter [Trueperella bialowiezensis]|uniref:Ferrous-iron efflux pump FieF n=1 Tax=Trueperella bialowiezensis TaxID=312285 RepID=A0A3S4YX03_9ACTO|nr:cation diffusion facilitator family transporter [Trueperella bialowiezensis]VEI12697.1 Ferrous-iron efflux pump FieF [Trueperella bialowiezensis]
MSSTSGQSAQSTQSAPNLTPYAWFAIGVAIVTIGLKAGAYYVTGSVSLLSDAMESVVNLVAAVIALVALILAAKPASSRYTYGRSKAEYFSAAVEGAMIFGAAALIIFASVQRLLKPQGVTELGIGLAISLVAALINGGAGIFLLRAGRKHRSITLQADGKHLLTDLYTSAGVICGLALVSVTGWYQLDPIIAILVAINILRTGVQLLREALAGLLDVTLPDADNQVIVNILRERTEEGKVTFHGLRTRQAGRQRFISFHLQVPGHWSVTQGHDFAHVIEEEITAKLPDSSVEIHVEPIEDASSYEDIPEGYIPITDDEPEPGA